MSAPIMPPRSDTGDIVKINLYLAYAAFLLIGGIWIWPSDPHWWGFYGVAVLMHLAAFGLVITSLRTMNTLRRNRGFRKSIEALGNAPKNAKLATKDTLQNGRMN